MTGLTRSKALLGRLLVVLICLGIASCGLDHRITLRYRAEPANPSGTPSIRDQTAEVMKKRLEAVGVRHALHMVNVDEIHVLLPDLEDGEIGALRRIIELSGKLEFRIVAEPDELAAAGVDVGRERARIRQAEARARSQGETGPVYRGPEDRGFLWFPAPPEIAEEGGHFVHLAEAKCVPGKMLKEVFLDYDSRDRPAVGFALSAEGASRMQMVTEQNQERLFAIIVNDEIHSTPMLRGVISDRGIIEGGEDGFDREEIRDLIATLKVGSYPERPRFLGLERVVRATGG